jgi:RNA polymerase sigma factor for flagellar operon FliA
MDPRAWPQLHAVLPAIDRIVHSTMRRLPAEVEEDDVFGAAYLGLAQALSQHRLKRHPCFEAYALTRIRGAIQDYLRSLDALTRVQRNRRRRIDLLERRLGKELGRPPTSDELNAAAPGDLRKVTHSAVTFVPLTEHIQEPELNPEEVLQAREQLVQFADAREKLPARSRQVVDLYYARHWSLIQIARRLRVSESRASQLRKLAVNELRSLVRPLPLEEDVAP